MNELDQSVRDAGDCSGEAGDASGDSYWLPSKAQGPRAEEIATRLYPAGVSWIHKFFVR